MISIPEDNVAYQQGLTICTEALEATANRKKVIAVKNGAASMQSFVDINSGLFSPEVQSNLATVTNNNFSADDVQKLHRMDADRPVGLNAVDEGIAAADSALMHQGKAVLRRYV